MSTMRVLMWDRTTPGKPWSPVLADMKEIWPVYGGKILASPFAK